MQIRLHSWIVLLFVETERVRAVTASSFKTNFLELSEVFQSFELIQVPDVIFIKDKALYLTITLPQSFQSFNFILRSIHFPQFSQILNAPQRPNPVRLYIQALQQGESSQCGNILNGIAWKIQTFQLFAYFNSLHILATTLMDDSWAQCKTRS